jgi:hypothetical protein
MPNKASTTRRHSANAAMLPLIVSGAMFDLTKCSVFLDAPFLNLCIRVVPLIILADTADAQSSETRKKGRRI